jgi:hypothetical protein
VWSGWGIAISFILSYSTDGLLRREHSAESDPEGFGLTILWRQTEHLLSAIAFWSLDSNHPEIAILTLNNRNPAIAGQMDGLFFQYLQNLGPYFLIDNIGNEYRSNHFRLRNRRLLEIFPASSETIGLHPGKMGSPDRVRPIRSYSAERNPFDLRLNSRISAVSNPWVHPSD